uniref:U1-type domain-containing protein n=1 Tax=Amphimedon queenslandica TaxID=400682 RepID=A0A1X7UYG9_AMPQE
MASTSDSCEIISERSDNSELDEENDSPEDHLQSAVFILDKLKSPTPSDLHRKRKMKSYPPHGLKKSSTTSSSSASEPKSVSPSQRVKEYPAEPFKVSNKRLFCYGCREELNLKSTTIANHVRSKKHEDGKKRLLTKESRERDIADAIKEYNKTPSLW